MLQLILACYKYMKRKYFSFMEREIEHLFKINE